MKRKITLTLFCCLFAFKSYSSLSQEVLVVEEVKAKFITNYVPYIRWPGTTNSLNICLIENDPVRPYLEERVNKQELKKYNMTVLEKSKLSSFSECHVIYINSDHFADFRYIVSLVDKNASFTISDHNNFALNGGIAEFNLGIDGSVKLKVNISNLKKTGLELDSDLLSIMDIVK